MAIILYRGAALNDKTPGVKECFIIAPIGEEGSDTRKRSDQVLKHVIRPAAETCGYRATRADEIDKPGLITSQVIQRVVSDPLVIADLTGMNPNVFYELAIRHAIKKPLVQIIQKGERIPFDVAGTRTIYVDHHDLDSVAAAKNDIATYIKELEKAPNAVESPISVALDLQVLRQSENPEDRTAAETIAVLTNLQASLIKIQETVEASRVDSARTLMEKLDYLISEMREEGGPRSKSRNSRYVAEIMFEIRDRSIAQGSTPAMWFLLASIVRDTVPLFYDLILEVARHIQNGSAEKIKKAYAGLRETFELTMRNSDMRGMLVRSRESADALNIVERFLYDPNIAPKDVDTSR